MEDIYKKFCNKKAGEQDVLTVGDIMYEFTKINECKYLVEHSIYLNKEWVTLTGTMTTMEASQIYKTILKNQTK